MSMKRKIYDDLLEWKNEEQGAVALLVEGARRVGKSQIVEEFAKKEYKSYILIDFAHINKSMKTVFDEYLNETDTFLMFLQNVAGVQLYDPKQYIKKMRARDPEINASWGTICTLTRLSFSAKCTNAIGIYL